MRAMVTLWVLLSASGAVQAQDGPLLPNRSYTPDQLFRMISPDLGAEDQNQPSIVQGYLLLAGNGSHQLWDIADPFRPVLLTTFRSPHSDGIAESHTVAYQRTEDGRTIAILISGRGVDFWDLTDPAHPALLHAMELEGIDYGDNTNAVWGVATDGRYVYAGGTSTGLHVIDARDPSRPELVARMPTSALGGVSAGPTFSLGNLLVVTTPKNSAGLATLDVSDPAAPALLDFVVEETDSYMGGFYGRYTFLLTPLRAYDVTTDPTDIRLVASTEIEPSEYMSFGDGFLFLGRLRPYAGVTKIDLHDPLAPRPVGRIEGRVRRLPLNDDQFSLPIGNLLVMSDDEIGIGSVIAVHDTRRDATPPSVALVSPADGAARQPIGTRIALSFTDPIDLRSVDGSTVVVRPVGGEPIAGSWGHSLTLLTFAPSRPLEPATTYEVIVPAGGVTDLVGNAIATEHRSLFSTGDAVVAGPPCAIRSTGAVATSADATLVADDAGPGATYRFGFGDGAEMEVREGEATHAYGAPGRFVATLTVEAPSGRRSCSAIQIVHRPLTPAAPTRSSTIAVDAARGRVLVVNPDADTVAAIDGATLEVAFERRACGHPRTLALAGDGRAFITCMGSDEVVVVEPERGDLVARIALPWGAAPYGIAASPDGRALFVTAEGRGELLRIDPATLEVTGRLAFGDGARVRGIAVTHDGARILVTRFLSPGGRGEIFVVDGATLSLQQVVPLGEDPGPDTTTSGRGVPNHLSSIAIGPDGLLAAVPLKKDNTSRGLARDGQALTTDNTVRTGVAFVELDGLAEREGARVDLDDHDSAFAAAWSPNGDLLFVASQGTNHVDVLDAVTGELVAGFPTGLAPQGLALGPDGRLYVQAFMSRTVTVHDVRGLLDGTDATGRLLAEVRTVAFETLPADVLLGKQIFYNADSRQMSQDGYVACATCHLDGGQDGRVWDFTDRGEGLRNTISLVGRAGTRHGPLHWSANFDEVQDFENDIRAHFGGSGFLAEAAFAEGTRRDPLGDPKAGLSASLDALAAYVSSLDRFPRSPYRAEDGAMTAAAVRGRALFGQLDCTGCHASERLTDSPLGRLHDVGTLTPASGGRLGQPLTGLDTPTLRGLAGTAPYLHDGSAATLDDVLLRPGHGEDASRLSPTDRADLVRFLLELEDEGGFPEAPRDAPDAGPPAPPTRVGGGGCSTTHAAADAGLFLLLLLVYLGTGFRFRPAA